MSVINVENLTFGYDESADNIFENVSFRIDTDWKLGFTGRNGRGKTTFMKLLMGEYEYTGRITSSVEFEYFPFDPEQHGYKLVLLNSCAFKQREDFLLGVSFLFSFYFL